MIHGPAAVARQALLGALPGAELHPALVNGTAGMVITVHGRPLQSWVSLSPMARSSRSTRLPIRNASGGSPRLFSARNRRPQSSTGRNSRKITPERDPRWLSCAQRPVGPAGWGVILREDVSEDEVG